MRLSRALSRAAGKGKQSWWRGARRRNSAKPRARRCRPLRPAGSALNGERGRGGSALREPGDTSSRPQLIQPPPHSPQSLSPAPRERGHHASPPLGQHFRRVPSAECHQAGGWPGDVVTRRSPICRCLSLPAPYNILPSTNRGSCNVRAKAGGLRAGVAPAQPELIGSCRCPTPGLWQAQATFKPCPLLTAGPMTLLTRCCFERTFASFFLLYFTSLMLSPAPPG